MSEDVQTQIEFINNLKKLGYTDVAKLNVNKHRKYRNYYKAKFNHGDWVFIKWAFRPVALDVEEFEAERKFYMVAGETIFPVPKNHCNCAIATKYIGNAINLVEIIKKGSLLEVDAYTRKTFQNYVEFLNVYDNISPIFGDFDCYSFFKMYLERWIQYSVKHKVTIEIVWQISKCLLFLRQLILPLKSVVHCVVVGDFNAWNCLCYSGNVIFIDLSYVSRGDPNIEVASFYVRLMHHARKRQDLKTVIDRNLHIFTDSKYHSSRIFNFSVRVFKFIERYWQ